MVGSKSDRLPPHKDEASSRPAAEVISLEKARAFSVGSVFQVGKRRCLSVHRWNDRMYHRMIYYRWLSSSHHLASAVFNPLATPPTATVDSNCREQFLFTALTCQCPMGNATGEVIDCTWNRTVKKCASVFASKVNSTVWGVNFVGVEDVGRWVLDHFAWNADVNLGAVTDNFCWLN